MRPDTHHLSRAGEGDTPEVQKSANYILVRQRYDGLRSSRTGSAVSPIPGHGDRAIVKSSNAQTGR
jgi:hypothetical protein